jgi:hypothetical protein
MMRRLLLCALLLPYFLSLMIWCAPAPASSQNKEKSTTANELRNKLAGRVTLDKGMDSNTPLKDAVEFLAERYDVPIIVDAAAFRNDNQIDSVDEMQIRLPKMVGVKLSTVLRLLSAQVNGGYRIRSDHVEITTIQRMQAESWADREHRLAPTVDANFNKVPFEHALRELADSAGVGVVVDSLRAGETGKVNITATFDNVPVDTAVEVVANMAGMRAVAMDNLIYVTSPENAGSLREERQRIERAQEQAPPPAKKLAGAD